LGLGILILGSIIVLISLLGCATGKWKKPYFAVPFIILTLIIGIAILVIGIVITFASTIISDLSSEACNNYSEQIDYNSVVSKYVCSKTCPCPTGEDDFNKNLWSSYDYSMFNKYFRSKDEASMSVDEKNEYETNGDYAEVTPLVFKNTGTTYSNWVDCYNEVLKDTMTDSTATDSTATVDTTTDDITNT